MLPYLKNDPRFARYEIGDFTYGIPSVFEWGNDGRLRIGKFCSIARASIYLGGNHRPDFVTTYPLNVAFGVRLPHDQVSTKGDVTIGNDVWIGNDALILSGVTIGDGAIVGARAVVAKDIPPYAVVVGNPGRVVRSRFDDDTIRRLLKVKWWDWEIDRIRMNAALLQSPNLHELLHRNATTQEAPSAAYFERNL